MIEIAQDVALEDAPRKVREALGWGPKVWCGSGDGAWLGRAIAWERLPSLGRYMRMLCERPPESSGETVNRRHHDRGYVYAIAFPAHQAIKIGATWKHWPHLRISGYRHRKGTPPAIDIDLRERCQVLAIVPCPRFTTLERTSLRWIGVQNHSMDGPEWCSRHGRVQWEAGGKILSGKTSEYFHETPAVVRVVSIFHRAMRACLATECCWDPADPHSIEGMESSLQGIGAWRGEKSCSSA